MLYELIILALLMREPAHGYRIAKVINDFLGPATRLSSGRLYPLLASLAAAGLIAPLAEGRGERAAGRRARAYTITELGRRRFHQVMLDTTSQPGDYQRLFQLKATVLGLLTPTERLWLIDHYRTYCQAHIFHLTAEIEDFATLDPTRRTRLRVEAIVEVMRHRIDQWRLELAWADRLRAREAALAPGPP
jgi:DNA-binding PadR family transcriptional regulator